MQNVYGIWYTYYFNPHTNMKKTEYTGSARTQKAYWYHMKAMHNLSLLGSALFQGTSQQLVLASSSSNNFPLSLFTLVSARVQLRLESEPSRARAEPQV